jgi:Voltage-dependent anion channel
LAELFPGYFALVMATGIIAVDALQQGVVWLARTLHWVDVVFYLALWGLYLARLAIPP